MMHKGRWEICAETAKKLIFALVGEKIGFVWQKKGRNLMVFIDEQSRANEGPAESQPRSKGPTASGSIL